MTTFQEITGKAASLMKEATDETSGMRSGVIPSIHEMQGLQAELVQLYYEIGNHLAEAFSQKELANIERKVSAARAHLKGRNDLNLTQEDAKQKAIESVQGQLKEELEKASLYEHCRILRDSVGRAIDHLTQTISTVKYLEPRPSTSNS